MSAREALVPLLLVAAACGRPSTPAAAARACHGDAEISCPRPIFNVADLHASIEYYSDKLGFDFDWEDGDPPDFASVTRGEATLFFCEGCQGTPGAWTMIFARDVDALYEEFEVRGAKIRMRPRTMPWKIRELHVADLDGNVIRFGTGLED